MCKSGNLIDAIIPKWPIARLLKTSQSWYRIVASLYFVPVWQPGVRSALPPGAGLPGRPGLQQPHSADRGLRGAQGAQTLGRGDPHQDLPVQTLPVSGEC